MFDPDVGLVHVFSSKCLRLQCMVSHLCCSGNVQMLCLLFGQLYMLYMCMVIWCILCIYAPAWKEKVQFGCQSSEWKYLCPENQIVVGSYLDQIFAYGNKAQWSAGSVTGGLMATCGIFDLVGQTTLAQASRASPQRQLHTTGRLGHLTMFHEASSIHSLSLTKLGFPNLQAIKSAPQDLLRVCIVMLQWLPSHCGIAGNMKCDCSRLAAKWNSSATQWHTERPKPSFTLDTVVLIPSTSCRGTSRPSDWELAIACCWATYMTSRFCTQMNVRVG